MGEKKHESRILAVFACLLLVILFSGCIGGGDSGGKYNVFRDKSGNERASVSTDGLTYVFDKVRGECYQYYNEKNSSYVERDAGAGWKFVQFDVVVSNNIKNNPVQFTPYSLVDTDNFRYPGPYTSNCMDLHSEICGEYLKLKAYNKNSTVDPGKDKLITLVYKVPATSVLKEFTYSLAGAGVSISSPGIPFLLPDYDINDYGILNLR